LAGDCVFAVVLESSRWSIVEARGREVIRDKAKFAVPDFGCSRIWTSKRLSTFPGSRRQRQRKRKRKRFVDVCKQLAYSAP